MTAVSPSSFWSRTTRILSVLLVLAVGVQTIPLRQLVHHVRQASTHHESAHHGCAHPKGYCPMNPDGPCRCAHDDVGETTPDEPTLRACTDGALDGVFSSVRGVWLLAPRVRPPSPRATVLARPHGASSLSPQRAGDDIFHPPRPRAPRRPGSTLQASVSA